MIGMKKECIMSDAQIRRKVEPDLLAIKIKPDFSASLSRIIELNESSEKSRSYQMKNLAGSTISRELFQ